MMKEFTWSILGVLAISAWSLGLAGCVPMPADNPGVSPKSEPPTGEEYGHDHADQSHGDSAQPTADDQTATEDDYDAIATALAKLSAEDRLLAEKQRICPVSEKLLGSMDAPAKVDLNGKTVFICCEGCEDLLREDSAKYLANLKQKE